ncbi:MAG: hypothetical protein FJW32_16370 [Acidobacteria bacterium]|nr:hypothetical protein [Acidobacteriota bacterium]
MSVEEAIAKTVRQLPAEKRKQVLKFAESLTATPSGPLQDPEGLWADFNVDISEDDIAELRREMWKDFPRTDI